MARKMDTKLNIHLQLPPPVLERVREANARLHALKPSQIMYGNDSPTIAHVTLLMGTISIKEIDDVLSAVGCWAQKQSPLTVHLDRPSLPNADGWVFLDAECVDGDLTEIRERLAIELGTLIVPSRRGGPGVHSHLTLGLCDGPPPSGYEKLFDPEQVVISQIGVGHVGENGTVIAAVASFELCGD